MAQGYKISIGVIDNITKTLEGINKRIAGITAPVQRFSKSIDKFKDLSGLNYVADGFKKIGLYGVDTLRTLGSMVPILSALTGGAILAGVIKLAEGWGKFGTHLQLTSTLLGTSVPKLQVMENAFRLAGSSAAEADASIQGLSDAMQAALSNKDAAATTFFSKIGLEIQDSAFKAKSGADKLLAVMDAIHRAYASGKVSDSTLRELGHHAGFDDATIALAEQGNFRSYYERAEKMGGMSPGDANKARDFASSIEAVRIAFENLSNTIIGGVAPAFTTLLDQFQQFLSSHQSAVREWAENLGKWLKTIDFSEVQTSLEQFYIKLRDFDWKDIKESIIAIKDAFVESARAVRDLHTAWDELTKAGPTIPNYGSDWGTALHDWVKGHLQPHTFDNGPLPFEGKLPTGQPAAPPPALPAEVETEVRKDAAAKGLDPDHMVALARQEHGPNISPKGAFGYMQLMPDTAKELGVTPDTPWQKQVDRGLDYYKSILDRNKGNYPAADAGYNAGPNHPGLPKFAQTGDMSGLPAETQKYVRAIGSVDVNVRLHNAPPGTQVSSKASGNVNAPAPLVMTPMLGMGY